MTTKRRAVAGALAAWLTVASPTYSGEVATTPDEEWISLSGKVQAILATSFMLDYGENDITVELDQFDWDLERSLLQGEQVTVAGRIDRNMHDSKSIEAAVVFVPRLNEYIYADPADEEGDPSVTGRVVPGLFAGASDGDWLSFSGNVTGVDGDEIMVDTGMSVLRVDTSPVPGGLITPSVDIGDRVLITGEMDAASLFDRREVEANSVTKLTDVGK